jgi:hypothetical protein
MADRDAPGQIKKIGDGREAGEGDHKDGDKKRKFGKGLIVATTGVLGAVASLVTILAFLQSQHSGPPSFDGDLTSSAAQFTSFLSGDDGKIAYIHIQCGMVDVNGNWDHNQNNSPNSKCIALPQGADGVNFRFILSLGSFSAPQYYYGPANSALDTQTAWVNVVVTTNTGAEAYNGPRGAGWIEIKGYFQITGMQFGDAPPGSNDYELRAVSQNITTQ